MNIWGFDAIPEFPVRPEDVFGGYQDMGMFGPPGSLRTDLIILPPESAEVCTDLSETAGKMNRGTGGGMVEGKEVPGRTGLTRSTGWSCSRVRKRGVSRRARREAPDHLVAGGFSD